MVAAYFGLSVDPAMLVTIILGIAAGFDPATIVLKTFFSKSVTAEAIGK